MFDHEGQIEKLTINVRFFQKEISVQGGEWWEFYLADWNCDASCRYPQYKVGKSPQFLSSAGRQGDSLKESQVALEVPVSYSEANFCVMEATPVQTW